MSEIHITIGLRSSVSGIDFFGGRCQRVAPLQRCASAKKILIFDEAVSHLDSATADHFAKTANSLKGKVTMLFITHQFPKGLKTDDVVIIGSHEGNSEIPAANAPAERQVVV